MELLFVYPSNHDGYWKVVEDEMAWFQPGQSSSEVAENSFGGQPFELIAEGNDGSAMFISRAEIALGDILGTVNNFPWQYRPREIFAIIREARRLSSFPVWIGGRLLLAPDPDGVIETHWWWVLQEWLANRAICQPKMERLAELLARATGMAAQEIDVAEFVGAALGQCLVRVHSESGVLYVPQEATVPALSGGWIWVNDPQLVRIFVRGRNLYSYCLASEVSNYAFEYNGVWFSSRDFGNASPELLERYVRGGGEAPRRCRRRRQQQESPTCRRPRRRRRRQQQQESPPTYRRPQGRRRRPSVDSPLGLDRYHCGFRPQWENGQRLSFELEVEVGLADPQFGDRVRAIWDAAERDSSLGTMGAELILGFVPIDQVEKKLAEIAKVLREFKCRVPNNYFGFHVSASISGWGLDDDQLDKLAEVFYGNKKLICRVARRQPNHYCEWADPRDGIPAGKYYALRQDEDRLEFRIFKATTRLRDLVKSALLVRAMLEFTLSELQASNLGEFISQSFPSLCP